MAFIGAILLFGLPLLIPATKYHCFDCGADFTPPVRAGQQARRLMYVAIFVAVLLAVIVLLCSTMKRAAPTTALPDSTLC